MFTSALPWVKGYAAAFPSKAGSRSVAPPLKCTAFNNRNAYRPRDTIAIRMKKYAAAWA